MRDEMKRLYAPMALLAVAMLMICAMGTAALFSEDTDATFTDTAYVGKSYSKTYTQVIEEVNEDVESVKNGSAGSVVCGPTQAFTGASSYLGLSGTLSVKTTSTQIIATLVVSGTPTSTGTAYINGNVNYDWMATDGTDMSDSGALISVRITVEQPSGTPVTKIVVSGTTSMVQGSTQTFSATVTPSNATDKSVTWSSSNTGVATVDASTGVVTAKSAGSTTITATANDGSGVKGTKSLTVSAVSVSFSSGTTTATTGTSNTYRLSGTGTLSLSASPNTCSISGSGSSYSVTFNEAGTYTLTAKAVSGSYSDTATRTVSVTQAEYSYVIYYYDNGSQKDSQSVTSTATSYSMTVEKSLSDGTNAVFKGWAKSSGGDVAYTYGSSVQLTSSSPTIKLYAVWEYTPSLSFSATGATGVPAKITKTLSSASSVSVPIPAQEPSKSGFKFMGWSAVSGGAAQYSSASSSLGLTSSYSLAYNESATLYAVWAQTYTSTLKYDVGTAAQWAGSDQTSEPSTSNAAATFEITEEVPVSDYGYIFKGWAQSESGDPLYGHLDGLQTTIKVGAGKTQTLYAVWYAQVTYDGNGGTPTKTSDEVKIGNLVLLASANHESSATPIEGGTQGTSYQLLGWSTDPNSADADSGYIAGARVSLNKSVKLYAIWKEVTGTTYFTVQFDADGGNTDAKTVEGVVESLPSATKADTEQKVTGGHATTSYELLGWSSTRAATSAEYSVGARYVPTANVVLYAVWQASTDTEYYEVKFDANGGTCDTASLKGTIASLPSAAREGGRTDLGGGYKDTTWTFIGWSSDRDAVYADPAYAAGSSLTPESDMILYAVWKENSETVAYTLTYDPCNGSEVVMDDFSGQEVQLARTVKDLGFTKEGYTLMGWSETKGSEKAEYRTGDQIAVSKDTVIYAVWVDATLTVYTATLKYDADGGLGAPMDQTIQGTDQADRSFTVTAIEPTKQYRQFVGWSETKGSEKADYQPGDSVVVAYDGEKTLYAVWTAAKATVTFDANGGEPVEPMEVTQGEKFELPSASMDGMDLEGWYLNGERVGGAGDSFAVGSAVTLTAQWKEHTDSEKKGFPWWILIVVLIALLILAKVLGVF